MLIALSPAAASPTAQIPPPNLPLSSPDIVAASISVVNKIEVAMSALHSQQHFSFLPGSSNNSFWHPQVAHCTTDNSALLPFGPNNIDVPPDGPRSLRWAIKTQ
jgi:hypothetical protein